MSLPSCIDDMCAYTHLSDHVFYQILLSNDKNLEKASMLDIPNKLYYVYTG